MNITDTHLTDTHLTDTHPTGAGHHTDGIDVVRLRREQGSTSEQRRLARDETIRAAEQEFVAAVQRALHGEETTTHRACAVQWAQILDGLRATRL